MAKHEGMLNLKLMRTKRGMTQGQLAEKVGVLRRSISCYETGWRYPRPETLKKMAEALDCDVKDIV